MIVGIIVAIVIIIGIGSLSLGENFTNTSEVLIEEPSEVLIEEPSEVLIEEPQGRDLSVNLEETMSFSTGP